MNRIHRVRHAIALTLAGLAAGFGPQVQAAVPKSADSAAPQTPYSSPNANSDVNGRSSGSLEAPQTLQEIVVTGSHVLTLREAGALPMRVISTADLQREGSPSLLQVVQALPEAAGSLGYSDSSQPGKGQGLEGTENINLRGLGPDRNLVLLNGHRLPLVAGFAVNTALIPMAAISRVEILKDAASADYGSDAITGVVNFITRSHFNGLKLGGDFSSIRNTHGNYTLNALWGHVGNTWNVMLAGGYQSVGRLRVDARSWSTPPYNVNPAAGWNFSSNPGEFKPVGPVGPGGTLAALGPQEVDVGCSALGEIQPFPGYCVDNVQRYQDLVAPQSDFELYGQLNKHFSDGVALHLEGNFAKELATVDYPPTFNEPKSITATVLPSNINPASFAPGTSPPLFNQFWVPMTNPGLAAYAETNPSQFPAGTTGIFIPIGTWRPFLLGGNPFFGSALDNSAYQRRDDEQHVFSADLSGHLTRAINWDANVTWGQNRWYTSGFDSSGVNIELALRGLGGSGCQWQTAAPGSNGCLWLNPMSNAIPGAPLTGVPVNPGYDPSVANTKAIADWLMTPWHTAAMSGITEANFHLNGKLGIGLPAGKIRWAAGTQFLRNSYNLQPSQYANAAAVPCPNSPLNIPGANVCAPTPNTPLGLAVAFYPVNYAQDVYAGYVEAGIPFARGSVATLAGRFTDYGANGGSAFTPQFRFKWQALAWLAFRGSVGTSFRAPTPSALAPNPSPLIPVILGQFRSEEILGNPNLKPEKATTFTIGSLVRAGEFRGSLDYWHYNITGLLTNEPQNAIVNALFPNGAAGPNNCSTLSSQFIAQHFVFSGTCGANNLVQLKLLGINGPPATFDGFDIHGDYRVSRVAGGTVDIGVMATHTMSFRFASFTVDGISVPGFQAAGNLNVGTMGFPLPKTKATAYLNYARGPINLRWSVQYNSDYTDQRLKPGVPGHHIPATALHNFAAVIELPRDVTLTLAVDNIFNKFPPIVQVPEGYDAMTSNPLGRVFHAGVSIRLK